MQPIPHQPFLLVVSAPSGTGKTTVCRRVVDSLPDLRFSISHTTRKPRAGEENGEHYYFVDMMEFHDMVERQRFLEHAEVYGNWYGTSIYEVQRARDEHVDLLVEIDVQGARQILGRVPDAVSVFILPPSLEAMESRLRGRGTDAEAEIVRRLGISRSELAEAPRYHYWIVNDDLDKAVDELRAIVVAERRRRLRLRPAGHPLAAHLGLAEPGEDA
jgi:guanylate kinase